MSTADALCRCGHRLGDHYPRGGSDLIECDVCDGNDFCEDFVAASPTPA